DEGPHGESLGSGVLSGVALEVDSTSRAVSVRAVLAHSSRPLRIGETVLGRIAVGTHQKAVAVPSDPVVPQGEGFKVFVVDSANVAHAQPVDVGNRQEGLVEITKGLKGGETVVTYGAYGVEDGARIAPMKP